MKRKLFDLIRSLVILYALLYLGETIAWLIPIGIPGSIFGLLLLFFGLTTNVIRVEWIFFGANLLIRYMAVLFVPVSVGIIKYSDVLISQAKALLIPNVVSSLITLIIIGTLADYLFMRRSFARLRHKVLQNRAKER
ncbi:MULTISPECIES: CidA/LrgA family protein [unclassified Lonepinella]|uniref:CidA/LrgA family protein n=1 Tax=unclassified Lonepinella TaxID=2642006 RepID=UPI0036D934D2